MSSYEPGSERDRAHRLLERCDVEVDQVYSVDVEESGMQEMADWLRPIVPEVKVHHVRAGTVYWVPK
jgi:hypothetical protein